MIYAAFQEPRHYTLTTASECQAVYLPHTVNLYKFAASITLEQRQLFSRFQIKKRCLQSTDIIVHVCICFLFLIEYCL